jgi:hypothetical protein
MRKPRPLLASFHRAELTKGDYVRLETNLFPPGGSDNLTPKEARRLGRKLIEMADYLERKKK